MLTPIVMAVGCRESDRAAMQGVAEALDRIRDQNIAEVADRLRSGVTDYPALAESLQREVAIRDETLSKMQATMNGMQTELQLLRARHPVAALAIKAARRARRTD